jgi:hypothetical protein
MIVIQEIIELKDISPDYRKEYTSQYKYWRKLRMEKALKRCYPVLNRKNIITKYILEDIVFDNYP